MRHPFLNRLGGLFFYGSIALCYVFLVNPYQWYILLRSQSKANLAKIGSWFFRRQLPFLGMKPHVMGEENIPRNRNFIVLANHQSFVDIGVLMTSICPLAFMAKKELFQIPFFGKSLAFMGCLPVDRGNPKANRDLPQKMQLNILHGYNYCVYPEGTRSPDGTLLPFKNGIFRIILEAPVPILPVTLDGTANAIPKKGIAAYRKRPRMVIHPPLFPEDFSGDNVENLKEKVRNLIASGFR